MINIVLTHVHRDSVKDKLRNKELIVTGDHWPIFIFENNRYNPNNPWDGLFRGRLLVNVSSSSATRCLNWLTWIPQGFKHIFNSPSSVEDMGRSTRAGNAQIHGMTHVTPASIAYVAMLVSVVLFLIRSSSPKPVDDQVRFVLGSATCFSRKDTISDSERFYITVYEFLTAPEERQNVGELLQWWDQ